MRTVACFLLLLGVAFPAQAESGYPFGKIFSSPEQRRALDEYRRSGKSQALEQPGSGETGSAVRATDQVEFSGYVVRSDGSQTVWIDGSSEIGDFGGAAGARHDKVRAGSAVFSARQSRAALKPGQTWLLNEGKVLESYEAPAAEEPAVQALQGSSAGEGTD